MTIYASEVGQFQRYAPFGFPVVRPSTIAPYGLTSAAAVQISSLSQGMRISADVGMLFAICTSSTPTLTSTCALRVPPNAPPEYWAVPGSGTPLFACAAST